jgi:hypothetical protein
MNIKANASQAPEASRSALEPEAARTTSFGGSPSLAFAPGGLADAIDLSPRMAAQRRQISSMFGDNAQLAGGNNNPAPVQRMISTIKDTGKGLQAAYDTERPRGIIPDHEGDHMTPFVTMQHEVVNAISGTDLQGAWNNLTATYKVYTSLPGWASSGARVQRGQADLNGYYFDVPNMLATGGDLDALLNAANAMVALRNQIDLSAMKGKKAKGVGHDEGGLAGGLQYYEQLARGGKIDASAKSDVIINMCMLFDHGRNDGRSDSDIADSTWEQHCRTVISAYPELASAANVALKDILPLRATYSKKWHAKYG